MKNIHFPTRTMKGSPRGGKYHTMADHVIRQPGPALTISLAELAVFAGMPLPPSAATHAEFWNSLDNTHVRIWRAAGWSARLLKDEEVVVFTNGGGVRTK